jgi:hypothetical protein
VVADSKATVVDAKATGPAVTEAQGAAAAVPASHDSKAAGIAEPKVETAPAVTTSLLAINAEAVPPGGGLCIGCHD